MSRRVQFYWVDVFATRPLTGNPLALVPDADGLSVEQMRAIAREFNQSETTFLVEPTLASAVWRLRSFTPSGAEVGGAGHNALGAWLWLADAGVLPHRAGSFVQQIGSDLLDVEIHRDADGRTVVSMDQSPPRYGACVEDRAGVAAALGLDPTELALGAAPRVVSTGAGHLLVEVVDWHTVDRVRPDPAQLSAILRVAGGEGCYAYSAESPETLDAVAYARFFNPAMGISEDPATGTAAGPLAALLVAAGRAPANTTFAVEQGHAIGRPSRIEVCVHGERVRVSGSGLVVASGALQL